MAGTSVTMGMEGAITGAQAAINNANKVVRIKISDFDISNSFLEIVERGNDGFIQGKVPVLVMKSHA